MKVGDKILCKKNYSYYPNSKGSWLRKKISSKNLFKKGRFYIINNVIDLSPGLHKVLTTLSTLEITAQPKKVYIITTEFGKDFTINEE